MYELTRRDETVPPREFGDLAAAMAAAGHPDLWACHAIQWGIAQYDKGAVPAAETARLPEPAGAPG